MSDRWPGIRSTAIIGAGIAGMSAARKLLEHGHEVTVFEKSRGPGGRAARRRFEGFEFDHGAQYLTAQEQHFRDRVEAWQRAGVVAEWTGRIVSLGGRRDRATPIRYVGVPGMSSLARYLGRGVEIHYGHRVDSIARGIPGWTLHFGGGRTAGPFDNLLLTTPPSQASELLSTVTPTLAERCTAVRMLPCWATMLAFQDTVAVDFDAAFIETTGPIRWLARNSSKRDRPAGEAWVIHARSDWTTEHLERSEDEVIDCMIGAFEELVGSRAQPLVSMAHRWRYALVEHPLGEPSLYDNELRIGAAGDWCLGARIECAFQSGLSAAARILGDKPIPG